MPQQANHAFSRSRTILLALFPRGLVRRHAFAARMATATSDVSLKGAAPGAVLSAIGASLFPGEDVTIKDSSGRSGAKSFLLSKGGDLVALVKVQGD